MAMEIYLGVKKNMKHRWYSWSRLLLWSHVVGVIGFYILLWVRSRPAGENTGEQRKIKPDFKPALPKTGRAVSIIVPARNEERNIRRCVTSLLEQDYDNYEVIVVDDGSTDGTADILDDIARAHPRGNRLWVLRLRTIYRCRYLARSWSAALFCEQGDAGGN